MRGGLRQQIADLLQKRGVGSAVEGLAFVSPMPVVDFGLQAVAMREQFAIPGDEIADDGSDAGPERVRIDPSLGDGFLGDEVEQDGGDLQSVGVDAVHDRAFLLVRSLGQVFGGSNIAGGQGRAEKSR